MKHYDDMPIGAEPGERKNPATRLRNLYIIALGLIACLTIASQLVVQRALLKQESDAPVINVAGRQRMLSQKLTKAALVIDEILDHCEEGEKPPFVACDELEARVLDLREVLDQWTLSHLRLQDGNAGQDLPSTNSPEVTALFEKIEPHYRAIRDATERFLASVEGAARPSVNQILTSPYVSIILNHEGSFLTGMNDIVFQYDAEAQARVSRLKRTELTLMSIILFVLLLEATLVFAPAARVIRRQFTQVCESQAWLSTTLKSIGDGVIATDIEGSVRFINPVAEALTGWSEDDGIGKPLTEVFVIINERTGHRVENPITRVLAEGVIVGLANHTALISKDGTKRAIDDSGAPLKDKEGHVLGAVLIFRDVTERKRAEEAVRDAQERLLEQRRREKERVEAELEKVRGELVARTRLATIGQVSASIAHELRNPLGAVRNAAYLLKRHVPQNEEKWARYLGIIDEEVNRADRTIRNLMEMSRPKDPAVQQVDLADIVREALDLANAPESVRYRTSLGVGPFLIHVDPSQLRQVLINLFTNAAQAIRGRGEIVVEARHESGYDRIVVRDSGPGVPTEHRGQLFEPLFSTKAKGTGLGLAICRQIIEQHGGAIECVEVDEGGAAFEIRLPSRGAPESLENGEAICRHGKRSQQ